MNFDPTLPKDPAQAAAILAALEHKPEQECAYPTCHRPRQAAFGTGRPSAYCDDPRHTAVNAHRARQYLRAMATPDVTPPTQDPASGAATASTAESLHASLLQRMTLFQNELERYVTTLKALSDPDLAAAQIKAALDQANSRVAEIQQALSSEQALRLKAEAELLTVQAETAAEREAAEQAIARMEEAEQRVVAIQAERDATIEGLQTETQQRLQEMQSALIQANAETAKAQEEARLANATALEARTQTATAERLIQEAHTSLERERAERDRLRSELEEVRTRAYADLQAERQYAANELQRERTERDRLRKEWEELRTQLLAELQEERRSTLDDRAQERVERERLRTELITMQKQLEQATVRADALATTNDHLREQLSKRA